MKTTNKELTDLLNRTRRMAVIAGKPMPQVLGCVLKADGVCMWTTSIVRDGKTSVSMLYGLGQGEAGEDGEEVEALVIPDIERLLGVLKVHGDNVTLTQNNTSLRVKSPGKQTTLSADPRALAFPHTAETLQEWCEASEARMEAIGPTTYTMSSGEVREAEGSCIISASDLRDGILSGSINGAKVSRVQLTLSALGVFRVRVGDDLTGETETTFDARQINGSFDIVVEGGLENVLLQGDVSLACISYEKEGQGHALICDSGLGRVYQRSVV